jgi:hypothetical protein
MNKTIYIFDVDDTLIATTACVRALDRNGREVFRAGTKVFNAPDSTEKFLSPGMRWDFTEFESLEQILKEPTLPAFEILKSLGAGITNAHIVTARQKKEMLYDWLREKGVNILYKNIHTFDTNKYSTVAQFKAAVVNQLQYWNQQDEVNMMIFEDDAENIAAMKQQCEVLGIGYNIIEPVEAKHVVF